MNWLRLSPLIILALANFGIAGVALARDIRKLNNRAFAGFAAAIGVWSAGIAGFLLSSQPHVALLWAHMYYIAPVLIAVAGFLFAYSFPAHEKTTSHLKALLYGGAALLIGILLAYPSIFTTSLVYHDWGKEIILNQTTYFFYTLYVIFFFAVILLKMRDNARHLSGVYSLQADLFFKALAVTAAFGMLFNLILPFFHNYHLIGLGPLFTSISVIGIGYSIVRHRMFDVRLVIARTLGYAISLVLMAALIGVLLFITTSVLFNVYLPRQVQIFMSISTAISALLFNRLKIYFDKLTSSVFYQDAYDPQEMFSRLNNILVSSLNLELVLTQSSKIIKNALKSEFCVFGLKETSYSEQRVLGTIKAGLSPADIEKLRSLTVKVKTAVICTDYLDVNQQPLKELLVSNNIGVLVRLTPNVRTSNEGLGYLILGPRKSGNPYTQHDLKTLDTIAGEMVIAIQNALHYEEIQNFNATLQAQVDEATRKLRRTNEKLKALDEAKDDFVSMASHQLRTPLTSIKGYTSMVLEGDAGKINATQRKLLEQSFASSQRMVYLIADLLNVSRLKTGKFIIEEHPVNMAEVVQQEIGQLQETAAGRSLQLTYDMPENFPTLMLDETKTRQVIMNFVDNAIYYTPAGGHIKVVLSETPASVEFRVIDDGIGVPKHEQPHLFTKFYRAGNARTARPDGTGLGLFMAKKVIVAQGGALIFETEEGKGSTFGFVFSKTKQPSVDGTAPATAAAPTAAVKAKA